MNAAMISRTLSLIPDRVARVQSGARFDPQAQAGCAHPERITHLAQFLDWLGPLREVTKDDLRIFGLITPYGRPAIEAEAEAELEADIDAELEVDEPLAAPVQDMREPALT
jgi:hypothetical protein